MKRKQQAVVPSQTPVVKPQSPPSADKKPKSSWCFGSLRYVGLGWLVFIGLIFFPLLPQEPLVGISTEMFRGRRDVKQHTISIHSTPSTTMSVYAFGDPAMNKNGVVLCMHGFPDTPETFRQLAESLQQQGYYVLVPFLRGYEGSSLSSSYYLLDLAEDMVKALNYFDVQGGVHLVGHDWGALVAYLVSSLIPERVLSVSTLAMPRVMEDRQWTRPVQLRNSWYMGFFQLRHLSDWWVERHDYAFIERLWTDWSPDTDWSSHEALMAIKDVFRIGRQHILRGALSYYRDNVPTLALPSVLLFGRSRESKLALEKALKFSKVPTQVIYGVNDGCVDQSTFAYKDASVLFPPALYRIQALQGVGHFMHLEKPREVFHLIHDWIHTHKRHHL